MSELPPPMPAPRSSLAATAPRELRFVHGAHTLQLRLPACAEALIDETTFADDERLPYWADLWPSARALARWVLDEPAIEPRVIELGCGVGLVALALRLRGAAVLATDYEPAALEWAERNARLNGLEPIELSLLDWRSPGAIEPAPLVVAADVLYEQRNAIALAACLPALVAPGGRFVIADPGRRYRGYFEQQMANLGWHVREVAAIVEGPSELSAARPSRVGVWEGRRDGGTGRRGRR